MHVQLEARSIRSKRGAESELTCRVCTRGTREAEIGGRTRKRSQLGTVGSLVE